MLKNKIVQELIELQKKGIEPFMTDEGWTEFWKILQEEENLEFTKNAG